MLQSINIAINLTAFLLNGLLLIVFVASGSPRDKASRWYLAIMLLAFVGALCEVGVLALSGVPGRPVYITMRVLDDVSFGITGFVMFAASLYFCEVISARVRVSRGFLWVQGALAIMVSVLVIAAQFVPIFAQYGADNHYAKGPLYWLYELFPMLSLLACTVLTCQNIGHLKRREWASLLAYVVLPIACHVVEISVDGVWLAYFGSSIALFLIYMNIQVELRHRLIEKEAELAQGRIAMMLSQIQPHFIFNTLTSISEVCEGNPLAQQSLITFSEYLRTNMDALTQRLPIPFARELKHVKQYLWLEQLRFEEKLSVVYNIKTDAFMLPVLTLQPIVENAVKHGITRKAGAGTVWIDTERTSKGICIVVRDDGVGFEPSKPREAGRSHTGIDNVRARVEEISGGRLSVESAPGQGTRVTICLPEQGREQA